jgi:hypothetical protein
MLATKPQTTKLLSAKDAPEQSFRLVLGFSSERARWVALSSLRVALSSLRLGMPKPSPALRGRPSQKGRVLVWSPIAAPTQFRRHDNTLPREGRPLRAGEGVPAFSWAKERGRSSLFGIELRPLFLFRPFSFSVRSPDHSEDFFASGFRNDQTVLLVKSESGIPPSY